MSPLWRVTRGGRSMSRIRRIFDNETAILSFLMGGDPSLAATGPMAMAMLDAGANGLVIGIPFSDPIEGAAGQKAHLRALASGVSTDDLLRVAGYLRERTVQPVLLQTYLNLPFRYGYDSFFAACSQAAPAPVASGAVPAKGGER